MFKDGVKVGFTGINFYSRVQNPDDSVLAEMEQAARDAGIGVYMDHGWGTTKVPQDNCKYDEEPEMFLTN